MPSQAAALCTMGLAATALVALHCRTATPVSSQMCTADPAVSSDSDFLKGVGGASIHVAMTGAVAAAAVQVLRATPCKRKANVAMHARGRGGDDTSMKVAYVFAANMSSNLQTCPDDFASTREPQSRRASEGREAGRETPFH